MGASEETGRAELSGGREVMGSRIGSGEGKARRGGGDTGEGRGRGMSDGGRVVGAIIGDETGSLTRRDREVVDFTRYRIKNNTELTNLGN